MTGSVIYCLQEAQLLMW